MSCPVSVYACSQHCISCTPDCSYSAGKYVYENVPFMCVDGCDTTIWCAHSNCAVQADFDAAEAQVTIINTIRLIDSNVGLT